RVAGWGHWALTLQLTELMQDAEPRVRFHAAMAFSRIRWTALQTPSNSFRRRSADAVRRIFAENASGDPYVRHAAVKALAVLPLIVEVRRLARDELSSVRFGALLALRRLGSLEVVKFLDDSDPQLVLEAARAIHDVPIVEAEPELAAIIDRPNLSEGVARRALVANFRPGAAANATALPKLAARSDGPDAQPLATLEL